MTPENEKAPPPAAPPPPAEPPPPAAPTPTATTQPPAPTGTPPPPPAAPSLTYKELLRPENKSALRNMLANNPAQLSALRQAALGCILLFLTGCQSLHSPTTLRGNCMGTMLSAEFTHGLDGKGEAKTGCNCKPAPAPLPIHGK